jgi:hypothetical protein
LCDLNVISIFAEGTLGVIRPFGSDPASFTRQSMKAFSILTGVIALCIGGVVLADNNPPKAATTRPATTQPAAINISDRKALHAHVGSDVVVEGTVSMAGWSNSGKVFLIRFVEADESEFQGAFFTKIRPTMEQAFAGDVSNAFSGAKIRITGKLHLYREHPEILVNDPKQITILVKGPANSAQANAIKS